MSVNPIDRAFEEVRLLEQLGILDEALKGLDLILGLVPDLPEAVLRKSFLTRDLRRDPVDRFHLVWQPSLRDGALWEEEWVRGLFASLDPAEIIDGDHQVFVDGAIVVDTLAAPRCDAYYFEMLRRGHRFAIMHVSDEQYRFNKSVYKYANCVIKNYWSPLTCHKNNVLVLPLGLTNGFHVPARKPADQRRYVWSFIGSANRSTRVAMLKAMKTVPGGFDHSSGGGHIPESALSGVTTLRERMDKQSYSRILQETLFCPCPTGMQNLESFRVYESLEAGCIPIVERRPNFDYFRLHLGDHPLITLDDWSEAPAIIGRMLEDRAGLERHRRRCEAWWIDRRDAIFPQVHHHITHFFKGRLGLAVPAAENGDGDAVPAPS